MSILGVRKVLGAVLVGAVLVAGAPAAAYAGMGSFTRTDVSAQIGDPLPASNGTDLAAWVTPWDQTRHVAYLAGNGFVIEARTGPTGRYWTSLRAGDGYAAQQTVLSAYAYDWDRSSHIIVSDARTGHIHELWTSQGSPIWHDADLTVVTGAPADGLGYARGFQSGGSQRIVSFLRGAIWELTFTPSTGWRAQNVSAAVPGSVKPWWSFPVSGTAISAGTQGIAYIGTDSRVHLLTEGGAGWSEETAVVRTAAVANPSYLAFNLAASVSNGQRHVVIQYLDANRDVHQVASSGAYWSDIDLTKATPGGPLPNATNFKPTSGFAFDADGSDHLFLFNNFTIYEFVRTSMNYWYRWNDTGPNSAAIVSPVGFSASDGVADPFHTEYVAYLDRTSNHLIVMDLTA
jgi:hypothetical protein